MDEPRTATFLQQTTSLREVCTLAKNHTKLYVEGFFLFDCLKDELNLGYDCCSNPTKKRSWSQAGKALICTAIFKPWANMYFRFYKPVATKRLLWGPNMFEIILRTIDSRTQKL